jgi:hypothetical protein
MQGTTRHILRYGIPGSLLLIVTCGSYLALRMCSGVSLTRALEPVTNNVSAAIAVALAFPLGFVIYQVYYWRYTPLGFMRVVSINPGQVILGALTSGQRGTVAYAFTDLIAQVDEANLTEVDRSLLRGQGFGPVLDDPLATPPLVTRTRRRADGKRRGLPKALGGTHLARMVDWIHRARPRYRWKVLASSTTSESRPLESDDPVLHAARRLHSARWRAHYLVVSIMGDLVAGREHPDVRAHWDAMADAYHGLGTVRIAAGLGVIAGIALDLIDLLTGYRGSWHEWVSTGVGVFVLLAVTVGVLLPMLNTVRGRAQQRSGMRLGYYLRAALGRDPALLAQIQA